MNIEAKQILKHTFFGDNMPKKLKPADSTFSKRLTEFRKLKGMTQAQLGNAVGVSQRVIAYYENETDNIPANLLPKLATVLKISVDELLGLAKTQKQENNKLDSKFIKKWHRLSDSDKKAVSKVVDVFLTK